MTITNDIQHKSSSSADEIILSFLDTHPQGVVATISKNGRLQGSVVNLFDLGDYQFAFMTKRNTRKYKNLLANPTISYVASDSFSRTEVEIEGIAALVHDKKQEEQILNVIDEAATLGRRHVSPYVNKTDDYALFIIYPKKIHMTTYWEKEGGVDIYHESIDFNLSMS